MRSSTGRVRDCFKRVEMLLNDDRWRYCEKPFDAGTKASPGFNARVKYRKDELSRS